MARIAAYLEGARSARDEPARGAILSRVICLLATSEAEVVAAFA